MTEIALITDTHFGVRNDSQSFLDNQRTFYDMVFFPELVKRRIKTVVHLGDVFDRRKQINFNTLRQVRSFFFDRLQDYGIKVIVIPGNHDMFFKNNSSVIGLRDILKSYDNIRIINEPQHVQVGGLDTVMCPWIGLDEHNPWLDQLAKLSNFKILLGHFEFNGFVMQHGQAECQSGLNSDVFHEFDMILTGHFHEPSQKGNVWYLGAPSEYTWADHGCKRGFHILNTKNLQVERIVNPYTMFHLLSDTDIDTSSDMSHLTNKIVRVVTSPGVDRATVDYLVGVVGEHAPHKLEVIDSSNYHSGDDVVIIDREALRNEDILVIMSGYVDNIKDDISVNPDTLKAHFERLYVESMSLEV